MRTRSVILILCTLLASVSAGILGLDIGHDFTKAALVAPGIPFEIVMSADSKRKDVSALAFKPLGNNEIERLYGSQTASYCTRFPAQCLNNLKPLLGKSADDIAVKHYLQSHPGVQIVPSKNNRNTIAFNVSGNTYPIEEIVAMTLQNIVGRASALLKEKSPGGYSQLRDVAVTVPGYFTTAQRNAIKDSVELAGLNLVSLVDDGLAVAVNYATSREFEVGQTEHHIIYDMGAGSTKATLVSYSKDNETEPVTVQVNGYSYDQSLGGAHFTNAVADIVKAKFLEKHQDIHTSDLHANKRAVAKLYQTADKTKLVLSANSEAHVSIESFYDEIDFKTTVTREEFEDYISDSSTRVTDPIMDLIAKAKLELKDLNSVILVGGSTRVPFVQHHLLNLLGEDLISKTINADEAAVFGAALRGVQISKMFRAKELNIIEPSTIGYAVEFDSGKTLEVFPVGTTHGQSISLDITDEIADLDELSIDIIEDGKRYMSYDAGKLDTIKSNFKFNISDCVDDVKYTAKFSLSESRLFTLASLEAQCTVVKPGFFDKLRGTDADTENDEDKPIEKQKVKKSIIPTKPRYTGSRPLGTASKQELKNHISAMDLKDKQRKIVSEKLNELEAALYSARGLLSDDDVVEKLPDETVSKANELVGELLEWLDYDSDGAALKEIRSKIEDVQSMTKSIKDYLAELQIPLDVEEFVRLHQEGVSSVIKLQEFMMSMGEQALKVASAYGENGLDFEEESKKLTLKVNVTEQQIDETKARIDATFDVVKKMTEEPEKLESMDRLSKVEVRREALSALDEVQKLHASLKAMHTQKMKDLKANLNKTIRAQKRAAAKEEAKKQSTSETEANPATDGPAHDEL